jgi:hypothetical protein
MIVVFMAAEEKMKFIFNLPCVTNTCITKSFICEYTVEKMYLFFYGKVMCTKSQPAINNSKVQHSLTR